MKERIYIRFCILFAVLLGLAGGTVGQEAYLVEGESSQVSQMIYTWDDPDTTSFYQDGLGENPDVGLMVCGVGQKYVGSVHSMANGSQWALTSYESGSESLPYASNSVKYDGQNCYRVSAEGLTISPSEFANKTPEVKVAAHPSDLEAVISDNQDGSNPEFIELNSEYAGSYSGSTSYNYSGNEVNYEINNINPDTDQGSESYDPSASDRGISSKRPLIAGVCTDEQGDNCTTGVDTLDSDNYPSYAFDVPREEVNDQAVYTRYGVANGIKFSRLDIGANLKFWSNPEVGLDLEEGNSIFFSQTLNISTTLENRGNVPVNTDFDFNVSVERKSDGEVVYEEIKTVQDSIKEGGQYTLRKNWKVQVDSGTYTAKIDVDPEGDLNQIDDTTQAERDFQVDAVAQPEVRVDGVKKEKSDYEFTEAGFPYNLTLIMKNSDGEVFPNSTLRIIEEDGMSPFAPVQLQERQLETEKVQELIESKTVMSLKTDTEGKASATVVPTGNVFLKDEYSNLNISDKVNYRLYIEGEEHDGTPFTFVIDDKLTSEYEFDVFDLTSYDKKTGNTPELPNEKETKIALNAVYNVFTGFWREVT